MFLKQIIIDGFKSYAQRTVVNDFDPAFNAITGLNGSGKSNVLDSICFVLGISNLSQVRASSLQDLVYKGGLAGISKATVSLIFNNSDKSSAPVGYEEPDEITITRQIVIGGRNRYLINGVNAQPNRVQNLFHSVGLNVNNPHFLIMQGRITKVINMKPPEVLSMIEEAAGTKMYELKKDDALRKMEKKQRKVDEINSLLEEKINPSLTKLERERKHYMEWNQNNNDIETLRRYIIAFKYFQAKHILERSCGQSSELNSQVQEIEAAREDLLSKQADSKDNLDTLIRELSEREGSGTLEAKQLRVENLSKKLVKQKSAWVNQKSALKTEEKTVKDLEKNLDEQKSKTSTLQDAVKKAESEIEHAEDRHKKASKDLEDAETAMLTGASASSQDAEGTAAGTGSLVDQLETARRLASTAQTELDSMSHQKQHLEAEYESKSAALAQDRANVRMIEEKKKRAEGAVREKKYEIHSLEFDPSSADQLNAKLREEKAIVAELSERMDALSVRLESCDFHYTDPYNGFDRRKVYGLVARLIHVKDPRMLTAIEVTAGGRLFQVVVDSDVTAKDLLQRGRVRRITILPLNKIRHDVLPDTKLRDAKQIENSAELALCLVGYDEEVRNAIEHVFGRTLICPDMNSAKRVTFDNRVKTRTVTLEGDTYDPSGTASGGSSSRQGPSVLSLLSELKDAETKLAVHQNNVQVLSSEVEQINLRARQVRQMQADLEVCEEEERLLKQQLDETATGRLVNEVESLKNQHADVISRREEAEKTIGEQKKIIKELERLMKDSAAAKRKEKEQAEAAIASVRTAHEKAVTELQKAKDEVTSLSVELEDTQEEIKRLEKELEESVTSLEKLRQDVQNSESQVAEQKELFDKEESELKQVRQQIASSNRAIGEAKKTHEEIVEKIESLALEKAKLDSKLREAERGRDGAQKLVEDLSRQHVWISQEKERFGTEGSEYEFSDEQYGRSKKKLETLEQRQEGLSKRINKKAMHMFERAKEEYQNLIKKKAITEQDKEKIEQVIAGLDEKKMVAVERTWRRVNTDFGNIFSDLLPGTSAKLEPPEGAGVEEGLEIRVAFGGVWKDSLSELSGGQRSLIALSLILAMLRFKPAPMYILDEVDAALDLSHTQNIGRMLRRHFSGSQFIVVSLKEGMFGNANVIFRTKFVDGVSTIRRTQNNTNDENVGGNANKAIVGVSQETRTSAGLSSSTAATGSQGNRRKRRTGR